MISELCSKDGSGLQAKLDFSCSPARSPVVSMAYGPLRSHGGLAEREVPMLFNRPLEHAVNGRPKNYDAFWVGLNLLAHA